MNICPKCNHSFDVGNMIDPVCPQCGEQVISALTIDLNRDFATREADGSADDDFEVELATDDDEQTLVSTQDSESDDSHDLAETCQTADTAGGRQLAKRDDVTLDREQSTADDDDFEYNRESETAATPEYYNSDANQPTIELIDQPRSLSTADFAERVIAGLLPSEPIDEDADYVIAKKEDGSELGSGASGIVYKARQKSLNRLVAIKLLKKQVLSGAQPQSQKSTPTQKDIEKFLYESQVTAGLDHPNVITVHDLGVTGNDTLFYSMKLFEGGRDWSKDFDRNSLDQNLNIFDDVCNAMRRAHRDRIVHRDLKPQNVLVGDFGEVQVTDWGLAVNLDREQGKLFAGGGTPCYMAPEMASHYLAQQDVRTLRMKLDWTLENTPDNFHEITVLNERIVEHEAAEQKFRLLINELSDVYVLGAILFQIASGYPPHLFQISDLHRKQWGSQTGRNKVRHELEMSASRTIAKYLVRDLTNPEAREALRDIALKAMVVNPSERYASVAELQQSVRDFRDFMRCIEDTHRGDREVKNSAADPTSYVSLNNAMYAYEGALENYPDYQPARAGLARAKFLFAERALHNQDFELGLSTMTSEAIEQQSDRETAGRLREQLITQRNRRDRRKQMLFAATMASLVSIGLGLIFGALAIYARQDAVAKTLIADTAVARASDAEEQESRAYRQSADALAKVIEGKKNTIDLEVKVKVGQLELEKLEQEKKVAGIARNIAETEKQQQQLSSSDEKRFADTSVELAKLNSRIAQLDLRKAQIDSEKIKENTQYDHYINSLKSIERNLDERNTQSQLTELFESANISLPIKNAWELHHLYKRAHPARPPEQGHELGHLKMLAAAVDGSVIVAVSKDNGVYRGSATDLKFTRIAEIEPSKANIVSMDVSPDGRWLVIARDSLLNGAGASVASLPHVFDLQLNRTIPLTESFAEQLQYEMLATDAGGKEEFFCNVQHLQILDADDRGFQLFMVDQRAQLGLNQLRCSVSTIEVDRNELTADVQKVKVGGQPFLQDPGLLSGAGCLANATKTSDGTILVAICNSHPSFALNVFSFDDAVAAQGTALADQSPRSESDYFATMKQGREFLVQLSPGFAPTALQFAPAADGDREIKVLVGNGKGELAEYSYHNRRGDSYMLDLSNKRLLNPSDDMKIPVDSKIAASRKNRIKIDANRSEVLSSTDNIQLDSNPPNRRLREPVHKSAVRQIRSIAHQLYSISETELLAWEYEENRLVVKQRLFGQAGNLAALGVASVNDQVELYAVSNLVEGGSELRRWNPEATIHDATIRLDDFRQDNNRNIVTGAADKQPGSQAVAIALDDGSVEYFSPKTGRLPIGKPADAILSSNLEAISRDDFRNGKFAYFEDRQQLVMYSNSVGLLTWNISDPNQTDPIRPVQAETIYRDAGSNSSVFFSADATGQNIVTSHPTRRNMLVLWQLQNGRDYVASELGPFRKVGAQHSSELEVVVEPAISPGGDFIAAVLRLRNSYQIQLIRSAPTRNPETLAVFDAEPKSNFRFVRFLNDRQFIVADDRIVNGLERVVGLVSFRNSGEAWRDERIPVPDEIVERFRQISVADVTEVDGELMFAGFGIEEPDPKLDQLGLVLDDAELPARANHRQLIAWTAAGELFRRNLPYSRRIAPRWEGKALLFMNANVRSGHSHLVSVDLTAANNEVRTVALDTGHPAEPAKRWQYCGNDHLVHAGDDWFCLVKRADHGLDRQFNFSLANPAQKVELAGQSLLVHHQDDSISLIEIETIGDETRLSKVRRLPGFYHQTSLSPAGSEIAVVKKIDNRVAIFKTDELLQHDQQAQPLAIDGEANGLTWVRGAALLNLGIDTDGLDCLATASVANNSIGISLWNPQNGEPLALDLSLSVLPLAVERSAKMKSFEFSAVSGSLAAIVWETTDDDRADIWKYALTRKPAENEDHSKIPRQWIPLDHSAAGVIKSVHFSEVIDSEIASDQIAPRIVIGAQKEGSTTFKLYALELGTRLRPGHLLDLFVAEKLQQVDQIIGGQFTGDGKTLLTMTTEIAQVRLTDGWDQKKNDVDFNLRIQQLQNSIDADDIAQLELLKKELELRQQQLRPSAQLGELERQLSELSRDLAEASSALQTKIRELEKDEAETRQSLVDQFRGDIETLSNEILEIQRKQAALGSERSIN